MSEDAGADDPGGKNPFEWAVFGAGLLLTLGTAGVLAYEAAAQGERTPPAVEVRLGAAERRAGRWAVPVTVANAGDETAEGVRVQVILAPPGGPDETAGFEVPFLPGHGERRGRVTFEADPAAGRLRAGAVGYETP